MTHSDVADSTGKVWSCQDTAYDQGVANVQTQPPTPAQGLPTTVTTYSDCSNQSQTALTTYMGYDGNGSPVASVDGVGAANPAFYGSSGLAKKNGCALSSSPAVFPTSWIKTKYTTCTTYDGTVALPTSVTNAFSQSSTTSYDLTQEALPTSITDTNQQTTTLAYSLDGHGNRTTQVSQPGESSGYTTQSSTQSTPCSTLPCYQIDNSTSWYSQGVSSTFYDAQGRAVETRTTGPDAGHDTIVFTVYNDAQQTMFQSIPFKIATGSGWVDPATAVDPGTGKAPTGTATFSDPLGRVIAVQDPAFGSGSDGITCSATLSGTYTSCTNYDLGRASGSGDPNVYVSLTSIDPNNHVTASYLDALGRSVYIQYDSGTFGTTTPNELKSIQYNVLNEPTSVIVTDQAPQPNQTTSVTTTAHYDALGRLTQLADPDRGTHTYTYDADGHVVSDSSGSRTLGNNYDLLGRLGCLQDAAPTINATGACTSGRPLVQDTYDVSAPGVTWGSTDYPIGRLTQSIATTYYPDTTSSTATQSVQYDLRGRSITQQLQLGVPSTWGVTTALPTYQATLSYNDANQPVTLATSTIVAGTSTPGYTTTQTYDATSGTLKGLSTDTTALATLTYNSNALVSNINFFTSAGSSSNLATEHVLYDGDLRPYETTATWQSGSGNSGQIFDQSRWFDPASNVLSLATTFGASGSSSSEVQNFCYNEQDRLIWSGNTSQPPNTLPNAICGNQTASSGLGGAGYTNSFVYTHLGQLWQGPLNGSSTSYQYLSCGSAPHQLSGLYPLGQTCSSKSGQVYKSSDDAWGNVTNRTSQGTAATLAYDALDHLVKWSNGSGGTESYAYDATGNRTVRRSTSSGTTTLTVYAFGVEEHLYSATGSSQGHTYYYTLGGRLIGERTTSPTATNIFLTDAVGSVLLTFSNAVGSAAVLGSQVYGPYGTQRYASGSMGTSKGFTGQYNDTLTGLDYYNARYYDPVVGVFLSADTVQGNLQGLNPYNYVGGNPETKNDPTGRYVPCLNCDSGSGGSPPPPPPSQPAPTQTQLQSDANSYLHGTPPGLHTSGLKGLLYMFLFEHREFTSIEVTMPGVVALVMQEADSILNLSSINWNVSGAMELLHFKLIALTIPLLLMLTGGDGLEHRPDLSGGMDTGGGPCSFTPQTRVATEHGERSISTLHAGDNVWAYNPKTHHMELKPILHVWIHTDTDLVDLTITPVMISSRHHSSGQKSEVIHTNERHPFFTLEQGFLSVSNITLGMHIVRANGTTGVVTGWRIVTGVSVMYNLEVAYDHTFTVGNGQWIVHNSSIGCGPDYAGNYNGDFPGANRDDTGTPSGFANNDRLAEHYGDHGGDYNSSSEEMYQQQAKDFMSGTPEANELQLKRTNGDIVRWNEDTGEFGVVSSRGIVRTYFDISGKPDPFGYFLRQYW